MAVVLVVEDGSGKADANSYASRDTGNAYAEAHLYADNWTSATDARKDAALAMATRLIDQEFQFAGYKTDELQALQWPRTEVRDPDLGEPVAGSPKFISNYYLDPNVIPAAVVNATCELAIQLLNGNRTGDSQGAGIKRVRLEGAIEVEFDSETAAPSILTRDVIHLLAKYGQPIDSGSRVVKLVRT